MKKTIFAMMAAAALCSCTNHSYTLTGQVAQEGDSVYLLSIDREVLASTAVDAEGKFTFKGDAKVPELVLFATAGQEPAGYLFLEKGEITLTMGEQNDQPGPVVTGTPANDAFTAYDKEMAAMQTAFMFAESAEEQLAIRDRADSLTEAMVDANLTNLFSAYIVAGQYAGLPSNELRELVASMAPDVQASWLRKVGYVPQDVFIFQGTLAENIALGCKEINRERVLRVLEQVSLGKWLQTLEHGIDTALGEAGGRLSGGQKQRIGIARALYKEIDVLLLDEATSALDNQTEKEVNETLSQLKRTYEQLTILSIAHRESSLAYCDRVITLEKENE
jgi:ABC-type lipoprotein export system ATPase subunit